MENLNIINRLLTVIDFNIKNETILAKDSNNNLFEVKISDKLKKETAQFFIDNAKFMGEFSNSKIDKKMMEQILLQSEIIIEGCKVIRKNEGMTLLEVERVLKVDNTKNYYHNAWTITQENPLVIERISNIVLTDNKAKLKR